MQRTPDPHDEPDESQIKAWRDRGIYMPTRAEIEAAKLEIRKGWAPETEASRRAPDRYVDMGLVHRIGEGE